jgi:hypothetical protein
MRALAIFVPTGVFVVLTALAMHVYPGGTAWDPTTHGHDFWMNYLCDLARTNALNGEPNRLGSRLTQFALLALAAGALAFWWSMPHLFPARRRLGIAVRALGTISFSAMVLVAFLPSDRFSTLHPILLSLGILPGLAAGACSLFGLRRGPFLLGLFALVSCATDFVLYAQQLSVEGAGSALVVIMERVTLLAILAWMFTVAWRLLGGRSHSPG